MKITLMKMLALSVFLIGVTACKTNNVEKLASLGGEEEVVVVATDDGALIVDTITITAKVTAKQAEKRKLTLQSDSGEVTIKVSPDMANYDQVKVGDRVEVVLTEEVAIFIGSGAPPSSDAAAAVALAPQGAKPGGVMADTTQVTVKVVAVDSEKHRVTLKLPDGSTKKIKVDDKVDLSTVTIGENLTVVITDAVAVSVTTP